MGEFRRKVGLLWRRQRLISRAIRARHALRAIADRTGAIRPGDVMGFSCVRNEADRLPYFLDHHRALGVAHFLVVSNDSDDLTVRLLQDQPDVSVWETTHGYKAARFGMDWLDWLLFRHGAGHWTLTLDADELLTYPEAERRDLPELTRWLEARGAASLGTMMLDLYPTGPVGAGRYVPGSDPRALLTHFDADGYTRRIQPRLRNLWIQGGPRARVFFAEDPPRAPTLNKIPLVRWSRRYVHVNSTHSLLPSRLNAAHAVPDPALPTGLLLHTKFLPGIAARAAEEKTRGEHFSNGALYDDYYDRLAGSPVLATPGSVRLTGDSGQFTALGLMQGGDWAPAAPQPAASPFANPLEGGWP